MADSRSITQVAPSSHSLRAGSGAGAGFGAAATGDYDGGNGMPAPLLTQRFRSKLRRIFDLLDKSGDGSIDETEWMASHEALGCDDPHLAKCMFALADKDASGAVNWNEFIGLIEAFGQPNVPARLSSLFRVLDASGDNRLDQRELRNGVLRILHAQPSATYEALMDRLLEGMPAVLGMDDFVVHMPKLLKFLDFMAAVLQPFAAPPSGAGRVPAASTTGLEDAAIPDDATWTFAELAQQTGMSQSQLKGLHKKFKQLDADNSNSLGLAEFDDIMNDAPIAKYVFKAFDKDGSGALGFPELARAVALSNAPAETRARLYFNAFDEDQSGDVSVDEARAVVATIVPAAAQAGSDEYAFVEHLVAVTGGGDAEKMCTAMAALTPYAGTLKAFSQFFGAPNGIDLEKKHGTKGDFTTCQYVILSAACVIVGMFLFFVHVAPTLVVSKYLTGVMTRDEATKVTVDGTLYGAIAITLAIPLVMYSVKHALLINTCLTVLGSFLFYLGLDAAPSVDLTLLLVGRIIVVMGSDAALITLLLQLNLLFPKFFVIASPIGLFLGFGVTSQVSFRIVDAIVEAGSVANFGLFLFIITLIALIAAVVLLLVVISGDRRRRQRRTDFGALNVAASLNSAVPTAGFRLKYVKLMNLRQWLTMGLITLVNSVFLLTVPFDLYAIAIHEPSTASSGPDLEFVPLMGRLVGALTMFAMVPVAWKHGGSLWWVMAMTTIAGLVCLLASADVVAEVVFLKSVAGMGLYSLVFQKTTHGMLQVEMPSVAFAHLLSRTLSFFIVWLLTTWSLPSTGGADPQTVVVFAGILSLATAAFAAGLSMYDARQPDAFLNTPYRSYRVPTESSRAKRKDAYKVVP